MLFVLKSANISSAATIQHRYSEVDNLTLCAAYHYSPDAALLAELERRHALSGVDETTLKEGRIRTGITECGLFAYYGFPDKVLLDYEDKSYQFGPHQVAYLYGASGSQIFVLVDAGIVRDIYSSIE